MENLELNNEMVEEATSKKSRGLVVGMLVAATAAVGTFVYKKFKKNKVSKTVEPISDENIFAGIIEDEA